jgi:hypothetical protein
MNNSMQTTIRAIIKFGSGYLAAHGVASSSDMQITIATIGAVIAYIWGLIHRTSPPTPPQKGAILSLLIASLFLSALSVSAQTNINQPPEISVATNLLSADFDKLLDDTYNDVITLQPFTTNGIGTAYAGTGINTSTKQAIFVTAVSFPLNDVAGIGAVAGYTDGSFYEGGLNFQLTTTNNWPVIKMVRSTAGDGMVYNFRKHEPANYLFSGFEKQFTISRKWSAGLSVIAANTSDITGIAIIGVADVTYRW